MRRRNPLLWDSTIRQDSWADGPPGPTPDILSKTDSRLDKRTQSHDGIFSNRPARRARSGSDRGHRINLRAFFWSTSILLLFFAAGLFAHGVHEFQEAGLLPVLVEHLYDLNGILDEKSTLGTFLKALLGYNGKPSLLEILAYLGYLVVVGTLVWHGWRTPLRTGASQAAQPA